jgi:anti-sigma B factor antagonist
MTDAHSTIEFGGATGDVPIVRVFGEIDAATAPDLRERLQDLQLGRHPQVVVDLLGVTFLDSTALGILVGASKHLQREGGELHLVIVEPKVRRVFEITGLTSVFPIHTSLDDALQPA